ncbi:unnamed protein product [Heterobilharzia americana]|nr:unnamed protein product [Heterobilharzia americana]
MNEEEESPKPRSIFISEIDCFVGRSIGKYLATQIPGVGVEEVFQDSDLAAENHWEASEPPAPKKNCFTINGTLRYSKSKKPSFAKDILDYEDRHKFLEHVLELDVIIYDITENPDQIKEVLWLLEALEQQSREFVTQKKFFLITNLMSWLSTKPSDPDDPGFMESEYRRRKPHPKYKDYLECEKLTLKAGKKHKKKLTTYVLACGVFYGCGEYMFQHLFKKAWLTQNELPIYLIGENILPTVHILDLARVIQCIIDNPPRQRYIVVRDDSQFTLSEIVKSISLALSNGATKIYTKEDMELKGIPPELTDILTMNLRIEPGTIKEDMQFQWVADSGIPNNITQLVNEFTEEHNLKPLRICILGPPCVGKTTLAKQLCQVYRLHHIHLKGLLFECIRNLLEPIKAFEHLQAIREEERLKTEMTSEVDLESTERALPHRNSSVSESSLGANDTKALATGSATAYDFTSSLNWSARSFHPRNITMEYDESEDYKNTLTGDEITSIRKSSINEILADLEYYPLSPLPVWNSEDELELLVNDCQERLEQLRENTDESGKLNDETLIRLLIQKLMSKPCQNQGFVLDGFPKTLEQAEALFRPDPEDEDILGNDKFPPSHRLITPNYVIHLMGSNALVMDRFNKQSTQASLNPEQAFVILPIWKACLMGDKYMPHEVSKKNLRISVENEREDESKHGQHQYNQVDSTDEYGHFKEMDVLKGLETQKQRHERRLQAYRAAMAPAAAVLYAALIDEANLLYGEKEEERRQTHTPEELKTLAAESLKETVAVTKEGETEDEVKTRKEEDWLREDDKNYEIQQPHEKGSEVNITKVDERDKEKEDNDDREGEEDMIKTIEEEHTVTESTLAELRFAHIPSFPEIPDDTEENVLTYFDIREIHPINIDMDKDFSPLIHPNGPQEDCFERVRKAIGRSKAQKLPSIRILPSKPHEYEVQEKALKGLKELQLRKLKISESQRYQENEEERKLLQKCKDDWNRWLSLLNTQNYQYAEARSLPMRHYLMKCIMPELSKALLECSEIRPEDPVDFVAEYLLRTGISK